MDHNLSIIWIGYPDVHRGETGSIQFQKSLHVPNSRSQALLFNESFIECSENVFLNIFGKQKVS